MLAAVFVLIAKISFISDESINIARVAKKKCFKTSVDICACACVFLHVCVVFILFLNHLC